MIKVNDRVKILKDIIFDYGLVAKSGEIDIVSKIDSEGFWLKNKDIYIEDGYQDEYLKKI